MTPWHETDMGADLCCDDTSGKLGVGRTPDLNTEDLPNISEYVVHRGAQLKFHEWMTRR